MGTKHGHEVYEKAYFVVEASGCKKIRPPPLADCSYASTTSDKGIGLPGLALNCPDSKPDESCASSLAHSTQSSRSVSIPCTRSNLRYTLRRLNDTFPSGG